MVITPVSTTQETNERNKKRVRHRTVPIKKKKKQLDRTICMFDNDSQSNEVAASRSLVGIERRFSPLTQRLVWLMFVNFSDNIQAGQANRQSEPEQYLLYRPEQWTHTEQMYKRGP